MCIRCSWVNPKNPLYIRYHDEEWGKPEKDDKKLYELLILEKAGLSKYEALQTATVNAAKIVENDMIGTIKCGKMADLVLLDASPMEDLNNIRKVNKVIFEGNIVDEKWMCNLQ